MAKEERISLESKIGEILFDLRFGVTFYYGRRISACTTGENAPSAAALGRRKAWALEMVPHKPAAPNSGEQQIHGSDHDFLRHAFDPKCDGSSLRWSTDQESARGRAGA